MYINTLSFIHTISDMFYYKYKDFMAKNLYIHNDNMQKNLNLHIQYCNAVLLEKSIC
jgi:hypothetical protein